jgi:hypothetical protein
MSSEPVASPPENASPRAVRRRFDWWQALVRVLSSIEAVRDGQVIYVLLAAFSGAGLAVASAQASLGRGDTNWAIGQGAAALFIAFYGANAAGLMSMDRARGVAPRDGWSAVQDGLGVGHRMLLAVMAAVLVVGTLAAGVAGLYWLSGLPKVGPWLFVLVVPATVLLLGLTMLSVVAVIAPLTGPVVWSGASSWQACRALVRLVRERLLQSAVLVGGLSLVTGLTGAVTSFMVMAGGRVMAEASIFVLGVDIKPEMLMAGLMGYNVRVVDLTVPADALPYIRAATVGGGVVFALALVLPTVVYLRGVCEVFLALQQADVAEADASGPERRMA